MQNPIDKLKKELNLKSAKHIVKYIVTVCKVNGIELHLDKIVPVYNDIEMRFSFVYNYMKLKMVVKYDSPSFWEITYMKGKQEALLDDVTAKTLKKELQEMAIYWESQNERKKQLELHKDKFECKRKYKLNKTATKLLDKMVEFGYDEFQYFIDGKFTMKDFAEFVSSITQIEPEGLEEHKVAEKFNNALNTITSNLLKTKQISEDEYNYIMP